MNTIQLLKIVKDRGLTITIKEGRPVLHYAGECKSGATDALLNVLKLHRERIIEILTKETNGQGQEDRT